MRFGHFLYPMNFDPARDSQVITDCLAEAALVEQLGLDALWMAEHHFTGKTVYGDAVVFAAAVAMQTQRILLGLGVKPRHGFLYIYAECSRLCPESSPNAPLELRTEGGNHSAAHRTNHCFYCACLLITTSC